MKKTEDGEHVTPVGNDPGKQEVDNDISKKNKVSSLLLIAVVRVSTFLIVTRDREIDE